MRASERFSSRAQAYARHRPGYPQAAIELLVARCGLSPAAVVADLGSGTGILSELLLERGAQVRAVEPNAAMRTLAQQRLGLHPRFVSIDGSAEATTLATSSVDLLVAAQAFHWFDVVQARREALRIVRRGAYGALLWNERPLRSDAFLDEYEALLRRYASEYAAISARRADEAAMETFFGTAMERASFANEQVLDFEGLEGRLMSSSYAPEPGDPQHEPMLAGLREVFARHAREGRVVFPYRTLVYFAPLSER